MPERLVVPYRELGLGGVRPYLFLRITGLAGHARMIPGLIDSGADRSVLPAGLRRWRSQLDDGPFLAMSHVASRVAWSVGLPGWLSCSSVSLRCAQQSRTHDAEARPGLSIGRLEDS
jgi:hypothetical protein